MNCYLFLIHWFALKFQYFLLWLNFLNRNSTELINSCSKFSIVCVWLRHLFTAIGVVGQYCLSVVMTFYPIQISFCSKPWNKISWHENVGFNPSRSTLLFPEGINRSVEDRVQGTSRKTGLYLDIADPNEVNKSAFWEFVGNLKNTLSIHAAPCRKFYSTIPF